MWTLIFIALAFIAGAWMSPAVRQESGKWYFYYSFGAGNRNKKKLF